MRYPSQKRVSSFFVLPTHHDVTKKANVFVDSIAGQMHAMKTGQAPQPKRRKQQQQQVDEDDSDEESGTDDDANDTSDTNTDTEDES